MADVTGVAPSPLQRLTAPATRLVSDAPTATAEDRGVSVAWVAPVNEVLDPITSYQVVAEPGGAAVTVAAPATSVTFGGLERGRSYTFTVAARTATALGPASTASPPTTPISVATQSLPAAASRWVPGYHSRWVSGYYAAWQHASYPETSVDFSIITHLFMARLKPRADGTIATDFELDTVTGPRIARTLSTRAHAGRRKAVLMLGGTGQRAAFVKAASNTTRPKFVANLLRVMDDLGYDGIDVDWEPIQPSDRPLMLGLLRALRVARPSMILTAPIGWLNSNQPQSVDGWYAQVAATVDQLNVMTYYMAGPWDGWVSGHHAPLTDQHRDRPASVTSSVNLLIDAGVPAHKIGVGIGLFGSCWRGVTGPRQIVPPATWMDADDDRMSVANILAHYYDSSHRYWDDAAQVPFLSYPSGYGPQRCNFISYEDVRSVGLKGAFVKRRGLGGVIVWTMGEGHLPTEPIGSRDPLLRTAYQAVMF